MTVVRTVRSRVSGFLDKGCGSWMMTIDSFGRPPGSQSDGPECDHGRIRWTPGSCPCESGDNGGDSGLLTECTVGSGIFLKWWPR